MKPHRITSYTRDGKPVRLLSISVFEHVPGAKSGADLPRLTVERLPKGKGVVISTSRDRETVYVTISSADWTFIVDNLES